jgi:L-aspartate oxidase
MKTQVLILGSGIAGLTTALKYARNGVKVTVVCKADIAEGATRYAQGGIASVWSKQDSFAEHLKDTLVAGAGLCHEDIVQICVEEGPERVQELIDLGVAFTRVPETAAPSAQPVDPTETFDLHREGGHGKRRILHADDLTGLAIEQALVKNVRENSNITVLENHTAIDLITEGKLFKKWRKPGRCLGAYVLPSGTDKVLTIAADITVLATGGAGKIYLYTSNPDTSTGDGIAMAFRAGAKVVNLEFMQFHPTCLYHPGARTFLITEALRGEGAVLKNLQGEEFMTKHHEMGSLAPRDVVARGIDMEMKRTGDKHVLLDATVIGDELPKKFPNIYEQCLNFGIDITRQPIPVVPAQHYTCGGVLADKNAQTTIENLYAVGEVAGTGLHGAHRAFLHGQAKFLAGFGPSVTPGPLPAWETGHAVQIEEQIDIAANWLEIRQCMWNYVGIVRSDQRLQRARLRLELLEAEVNAYYWDFLLTKDLIELRNLLTVAQLVVQCALLRKESRGLHYTVDYPEKDDAHFKHDTVLVRGLGMLGG